MLNSKEFGKRISSLRKAAKITQKELAKRCFVSAQAISKWENGISSPNILMLKDIAVALGVEINDLFKEFNADGMMESGEILSE